MVSASIQLRDYQTECVEKTLDLLRQSRSVLNVLATGLGKTIALGSLCDRWEDRRCLVIAHTRELVLQNAEKVGWLVGRDNVAIEMADLRAGDLFGLWGDPKVVCASRQSLVRRLDRYDPAEFGLVIIDEAHHSPSSENMAIVNHFAQAKIIGWTATPDRADEVALGKVYQTVGMEMGILDGIHLGWLSPIQQQSIYLGEVEFGGDVSTSKADFSEHDLRIFNQEKVCHAIATPTIQLAGDRPTLVFSVGVEQAHKLAEIINRHKPGQAVALDGGTNLNERTTQLKRFEQGEFQFLCGCALFLEGFDSPRISCVAMARPTKSRALYSQAIGRGTRVLPGVIDRLNTPQERLAAIAASGKPNLLILDFVGNAGRHKLINAPDILGGNYDDAVVERAKKKQKESDGPRDVEQVLEEVVKELEEERLAKRRHIIAERVNYRVRDIDPFDVFDLTAVREPGWHKGRKPTPKQLATLKAAGVEDKSLKDISFCKASALLDKIISRRRESLCTFKQARVLAKYGERTDVTFAEARKIIDEIAANHWKPRAGAIERMMAEVK